ncbi:membrane magnesium transporter family protein [Aspergillus saccharolyticus JOP 1030-1]|uniref:Magnesium transporter n=1 Tax=Aspergillus saccharolyticus JOP 1030-1 TaxID=1450539 RepID=A0A318ZKS9_9EURO|nr:hypothetical protein BP01DRAFT_321263 [Aspergillus saccharolyticus JOP 1030-1]PYH44390.1 hypothetical protein BP01DRAFT_321263 [Aspergillus saccharolyticus JOP 1030-1]
MGFFSRLFTFIGLVLLAHAGYSAHEHTLLTSSNTHTLYSTTTATTTTPHLPPDIVIEALVALVIVSVGLVLGTEKLKPISWRDWAGEIEREGNARHPYRRLDERYSFWDVRAKRKEFADWIRAADLGEMVEEKK